MSEDLHLDSGHISKGASQSKLDTASSQLPQQETVQFVRLNAPLHKTADPFKGTEEASLAPELCTPKKVNFIPDVRYTTQRYKKINNNNGQTHIFYRHLLAHMHRRIFVKNVTSF